MTEVLVVEDEPLVAFTLMRALRSFEPGLATHHVASPQEALAWLAARAAGGQVAVVSDFNMGASMNGVELLREVAQRWPAVRRVLTSGYARSEVLADVEPSLLHGFLAKPWELEAVQAVIEAARAAPHEPQRG